MQVGRWIVPIVGAIVMLLAGCNVAPDTKRTPTIDASPTQDETAIALAWTDTPRPTATISPTRTYTLTPTPSNTPEPSSTLTLTVTASLTATRTLTTTPSLTRTSTATFTQTRTSTATTTQSRTPTLTRTLTLTRTPTATFTQTRTPTVTATVTRTLRPSATPSPTMTRTFTHTPTFTLTYTLTPSITPINTIPPTTTPLPTIGRTATPTSSNTPAPSLTMTLFPSATPIPQEDSFPPLNPSLVSGTPTSQVNPSASGTPLQTFVPGVMDNPNSTLGPGVNLPSITPLPSTTPLPPPQFVLSPTPFQFGSGERVGISSIVIFNGSGHVSLDGAPQVAEWVWEYDTSPQGQRGEFAVDRNLYINSGVWNTSPSSEYGFPGHKDITEIRWSPNGRYMAFIISGKDPNEYDYGVWIYDSLASSMYQVMKSDVDYREAIHLNWASNSNLLLIQISTQYGYTHTFLAPNQAVGNVYAEHPYSNATWSLDNASLIVSGRITNGQTVLGRVMVSDQSFVPYNFMQPDLIFAYAAIELAGGQIGFLGSLAENGPYHFYKMYPNSTPALAFSTSIMGTIASWEWNRERSNLLLVVDTTNGRRIFTLDIYGNVQDMTPIIGVTGEVRWR